MVFENHLRVLSEMPSCFEMEAQVREYCEDILRDLGLATGRDNFGNLFATRPGGRPGHVLLCAHMDKRMDTNLLGTTNRHGNVPTHASVLHLADVVRCRFFACHEGRFRPISLMRGSEGYMAGLAGEPTPPWGTCVYALPVLAESDGLLSGKFDDALGLALILEVLEETRADNCPTISALLTVGEEGGLRGASYAVKDGKLYELNPGSIIVVDTSPLAEPGDGLILYEDCGRAKEDDTDGENRPPLELAGRLRRFAQETGVRLTTLPAKRNDAFVFGRHTTIPTVALEVPIDHMHEAIETIARRDVELMRQFLRGFLQSDL